MCERIWFCSRVLFGLHFFQSLQFMYLFCSFTLAKPTKGKGANILDNPGSVVDRRDPYPKPGSASQQLRAAIVPWHFNIYPNKTNEQSVAALLQK